MSDPTNGRTEPPSVRPYLVVLAVLGLVMGLAGPASGGSRMTDRRPATAIGDSIMLSARTSLQRASTSGIVIDAEVGRQFTRGLAITRARAADDRLRRNVVVHLGTNGPVTLPQCRALVRASGRERQVFLVDVRVPRWWGQQVNTTLRACNDSFQPERVKLVRWRRHAAAHPGWLAADGYHLSAAGRDAYARYLTTQLRQRGR